MIVIFSQLGDQQTHIKILGGQSLQDAISNAFVGPFVAERERFATSVESENVNRVVAFGLRRSFRIKAGSQVSRHRVKIEMVPGIISCWIDEQRLTFVGQREFLPLVIPAT